MSDAAQPVRCSGMIFEHYHHRQCIHPGKVMREGKMFCGTHDPLAIKAREDKRNARWEAQRDADAVRYAEARKLRERAELCVRFCEGLTNEELAQNIHRPKFKL